MICFSTMPSKENLEQSHNARKKMLRYAILGPCPYARGTAHLNALPMKIFSKSFHESMLA